MCSDAAEDTPFDALLLLFDPDAAEATQEWPPSLSEGRPKRGGGQEKKFELKGHSKGIMDPERLLFFKSCSYES